jgi:CpeT protein
MTERSTEQAQNILGFAKTLCGEYDNLLQSQENPKDFARINIFFRPLPWDLLEGPGFYSEQCYDYAPWNPYRQGLHRLNFEDGIFKVENFGYRSFNRLAGAGKHPELLKSLNADELEPRCGCAMHFTCIGDGHYQGSVEPGKKCLVPRDGKMTYLVSEVEVNQTDWISRDRGFDPVSDEQCWGSEHGKLRFKRVHWFGNELNEDWAKTRGSDARP